MFDLNMPELFAQLIAITPLALVVASWYELGKMTGEGKRKDRITTFWGVSAMMLGGIYITRYVPWALGLYVGG